LSQHILSWEKAHIVKRIISLSNQFSSSRCMHTRFSLYIIISKEKLNKEKQKKKMKKMGVNMACDIKWDKIF